MSSSNTTVTALSLRKPLPLTVIVSPAPTTLGSTCTTGRYPKWSDDLTAELPKLLLTRTSTVSTACAGAVICSLVLETTCSALPAVEPKRTDVIFEKPDPVTVTLVAPVNGPVCGDTEVTAGGARYL